MTDDRTMILYADGEQIVLKNRQIDRFLDLGEELDSPDRTLDPLPIARKARFEVTP